MADQELSSIPKDSLEPDGNSQHHKRKTPIDTCPKEGWGEPLMREQETYIGLWPTVPGAEFLKPLESLKC